ncbi:MAG: hypothetical protein KDC43_03295 [Saprospiraceae bacterium]|nr:hypothetical protein [Saprospiraceae bacterium]MCB0622959.1 hypothetical protein [Saprospiraceae bacterium]MCB0675509.1 hypothetical protein [Saprospiraceae bacterium]
MLTRIYQTCFWLALGFSIFLPIEASAQPWSPQDSHSDEKLRDVFFVDEQTGWAAGESDDSNADYLRKTVDQGVNWLVQEVGQDNLEIQAIHFLDSLTGFLVGELESGSTPGFLAVTTDGGDSWEVDETTFPQKLYGLVFIGSDLGWVAGNNGYIAHSSDGGSSWEVQSTPTDRKLNGIAFAHAQLGLAVGDHGRLLRTIDGGANWEQADSGTDEDLLAVSFGSDTHAWAVGDKGTVLATTDGGLNWESQQAKTDRRLFDVDAVSAEVAWLVGKDGIVRRTTDGGNEWVEEDSGTERDIFAVDMLSDSLGWHAGQHGNLFIYQPSTFVSVAVGLPASERITLSPNPVSMGGQVQLLASRSVEYQVWVHDALGRLLWSGRFANAASLVIPMAELPAAPGFLWVRVYDAGLGNLATYPLAIH